MHPDKSQLDTLELYLKKIVSEEKAQSTLKRFATNTDNKAQEAIRVFETRNLVRIQDIERLLGA